MGIHIIRRKPKKKIRLNPLSSFTPAQVKQMINHGKVFVNGRKVKSGNFQLNTLDKIEVKGFIGNLNKESIATKKNVCVKKTDNLKKESFEKKNYSSSISFKKNCLSLIKKNLEKNQKIKIDETLVNGLIKKAKSFEPKNSNSF